MDGRISRRRRSRVVAIALALATPARMAAGGGDIAVRLDWPGGLEVRCDVPLAAARLVLVGGTGADGQLEVVAGLDGPVVRAGPLVATGLLRLAARPLGSDPGGSAPVEPTGLRLEATHAAGGQRGFLLVVVPGTFAVFLRGPPSDPGGTLGCLLGPLHLGPLALDAAATFGEAVPSPAADAWYTDAPPTPTGRAYAVAARLRVSLPWLALSLGGGASGADHAPPGWFTAGAAAIDAPAGALRWRLDLIAAAASRDYRGPGTDAAAGGAKVGARLRLDDPRGGFDGSWTLSVEPPGFLSGPWLPSVEEVRFAVERCWESPSGAWTARIAGANRVQTGAMGPLGDGPGGGVTLGWDGGLLDAAVGVGLERDAGIVVDGSVGVAGRRGGPELDLSLRGVAGDGVPLARVGVRARLPTGSGDVAVGAGVDDVPLVRGGGPTGRPWASLSWRVRATAAGGAAP